MLFVYYLIKKLILKLKYNINVYAWKADLSRDSLFVNFVDTEILEWFVMKKFQHISMIRLCENNKLIIFYLFCKILVFIENN